MHASRTPEVRAHRLWINSPNFRDGEQVPRKYTGDGDNVSPPLSWSDLPRGTRELALVVEDPDATGPFPFVHWVVYKIGAALDSLPEGTGARTLPAGVVQGRNSFEKIGYDGPAPPPGRPHRYQFRLYALDHVLDQRAGLDKKALLIAMEGHSLAEAVLTGLYERGR